MIKPSADLSAMSVTCAMRANIAPERMAKTDHSNITGTALIHRRQ